MFESIASIEIGTTAIRVLAVKRRISTFQVTDLLFEEINGDAESREMAVRDAMERILQRVELHRMKVITVLPMEHVLLRTLSFPFSELEKIAEALPFEAEENIPYGMDDVSMDFLSLHCDQCDGRRILMAAVHRDSMHESLSVFRHFNIVPHFAGLEADSLHYAYKHFSTVEGENVIQIHLGHEKTVINLIQDSGLLFTRAIAIGTGFIAQRLQSVPGMTDSGIDELLRGFKVDIHSLDATIRNNDYSAYGLKRSGVKKVHTIYTQVFNELLEHIDMTLKSFAVEYGSVGFSRILLSGGGALIHGSGAVMSRHFDIPVVSHPFIDEYDSGYVKATFPVTFGTIVSFMQNRSGVVDFLKGEFLQDALQGTKKRYYLAAFFTIAGIAVLLLNFIAAIIINSHNVKSGEDELRKRYIQYFGEQTLTSDDPMESAKKLLRSKRKELADIAHLSSEDDRVLALLEGITSAFPQDVAEFRLKNLILQEKAVRIDGTIGSAQELESFKSALEQNRAFASVTSNIRMSRNNEVHFVLTINLKAEDAE